MIVGILTDEEIADLAPSEFNLWAEF